METLKKTRFIWDFRKETEWLHEMAESGWFLKEMKLGVRYLFEKGEPKNMVYEVDRFNLPAHPTEEQITQKEDFIEMARELGWEVVLHDEDLNYYFAKEYEEGGMNELYDTDEARRLHAEKYTGHFRDSGKIMSISTGVIFLVVTLMFALQMSDGFSDKIFNGFMLFFMSLGTLFVFLDVLLYKMAKTVYEQFVLSREEWQEQYLKRSCERKESKLFLNFPKNHSTNFNIKLRQKGKNLLLNHTDFIIICIKHMKLMSPRQKICLYKIFHIPIFIIYIIRIRPRENSLFNQ